MSGAPRPRITTRDPGETTRRLSGWLATRLPGSQAVAATVPASNGMSSETLLFDIDHPRPPVRSCALRLAADPAAYTVFPTYDMARQYRTMRLVAEHTDVPVPRVLWLEEDPAPLGAPFFVMERAEGRVPPDVMPYTYEGSWLHAATDAERADLEAATVSVLARIHDQVPVADAEFLALPGSGSALRRHVAAQRAYYAWVVEGREPSPLIERGFAWIADHWPSDTERAVGTDSTAGAVGTDSTDDTVLTWGDARIGNIVYDGFRPVAVLDWEMAVPGPRELDLGWMIYLHRFFQDLAESGGQGGLPGLLRRDHVEERYARLTGHTPRAMDFHTLYAALRHAVVMLRVAYRRIHFGEMSAPADPDALIMHRAALEAMIEGRYW
ncbi:aminoglycoside phosphotransferase [Streptomyces sp. CB02923]|uniref:phosphotransferase family protein n=1 Tax=Streptomyces sp. CB02923 TaxID=1718985 RepID=UPI00093EB742|nr:phosphotransferase family protein [Streptomyces sp. CB02923]OKI02461.1 aminoglycoside phosphotransferase [Streptomyces sp. CB02923]